MTKKVRNVVSEIEYMFESISSLSDAFVDFQSSVFPGIAIISKDLSLADEAITQYSKSSSEFLEIVDVVVGKFDGSESLAQYIFQQLQNYANTQNIRFSRAFEAMYTKDSWNNINLLTLELCIKKEKPVLIILRGFQDICRYFTDAQLNDYMQLRERKFALLLSASVPLRDIENASVGFHTNSTLTDSIPSIEMSE